MRCESDMCFYWKKEDEYLVVVGVYVDDLLTTGTSVEAVERLFESLSSLSIKDLGRVSKFLGMRVNLDDTGKYTLDQEEAIADQLQPMGWRNQIRRARLLATTVTTYHRTTWRCLDLQARALAQRSAVFIRLSGVCCGVRVAHGRTSRSLCTRLQDRLMHRE